MILFVYCQTKDTKKCKKLHPITKNLSKYTLTKKSSIYLDSSKNFQRQLIKYLEDFLVHQITIKGINIRLSNNNVDNMVTYFFYKVITEEHMSAINNY